MRAPAGDPQLDPAQTLAALRPILENPHIQKVGQNLKYDMIVFRNAGIHLAGTAFDTMVADYLLAPGERSHGVDDLAKRYLNHDTIKIRELIGSGKTQRRMDEVPVAEVTRYAAEDADIPLRLSEILAQRLEQDGLDTLFHQLEMPLVEVLAEMEFHGIKVDVPRLRQLSKQYGERMAELEAEIYAEAGRPFNIDSPKQLAKVLFDDLGLPQIRRTKTGPSTDVEVLNELAAVHTLPAKIIEYRQQAKLKSTYVDALPELVHPQTGRVHTSFKQDVAATGRLSSTDPNLQNIPVRTRDGREIRAAFVPGDPAWQLLCADYSQIELRVLSTFLAGRGVRAGVCRGSRHSRAGGQRSLLGAVGGSDAGDAAGGQGHQLRDHLRPESVRAGQGLVDREVGCGEVHRSLLREVPGSRRLHGPNTGGVSREGVCYNHLGASSRDPGCAVRRIAPEHVNGTCPNASRSTRSFKVRRQI